MEFFEYPLRPHSTLADCQSEVSFQSFLSLPEEILIADDRYRLDADISPSSVPPPVPRNNSQSGNSMANIAPWEQGPSPETSRMRIPKSSADSPTDMRLPQIPRQLPITLASPTPQQGWRPGVANQPAGTPLFSSFYDDSLSSEEMGAQISPAFRPSSSSQEDMGYNRDDRRPSVASATTVSSIGSKSSMGRGFHKKLGNFFGEEPDANASRQNSESSLLPGGSLLNYPSNSLNAPRQRNNSNHTLQISRPVSPSSIAVRPRTPHPHEVTPWEFDPKVSRTESLSVMASNVSITIACWPHHCVSFVCCQFRFLARVDPLVVLIRGTSSLTSALPAVAFCKYPLLTLGRSHHPNLPTLCDHQALVPQRPNIITDYLSIPTDTPEARTMISRI